MEMGGWDVIMIVEMSGWDVGPLKEHQSTFDVLYSKPKTFKLKKFQEEYKLWCFERVKNCYCKNSISWYRAKHGKKLCHTINTTT